MLFRSQVFTSGNSVKKGEKIMNLRKKFITWSTCPIVPILMCGLFLSKCCFAILFSSEEMFYKRKLFTLIDLVYEAVRQLFKVVKLHDVNASALCF